MKVSVKTLDLSTNSPLFCLFFLILDFFIVTQSFKQHNYFYLWVTAATDTPMYNFVCYWFQLTRRGQLSYPFLETSEDLDWTTTLQSSKIQFVKNVLKFEPPGSRGGLVFVLNLPTCLSVLYIER